MFRFILFSCCLYLLSTHSIRLASGQDAPTGRRAIDSIEQLALLDQAEIDSHFRMSFSLHHRLSVRCRSFHRLKTATPLCIAIASGNYVDASFLVGRGALATKATTGYLSPLWVLIKSRCDDPKGRCEVARLLIHHGADLHSPRPNHDLELPTVYMIDEVISSCDVELTRVLLEHGAVPSAKSCNFIATWQYVDSQDPDELPMTHMDLKALRKMGELLSEKGFLLNNTLAR